MCKKCQSVKPDFKISINISYIQILKSQILEEIIHSIEETEVEPSSVITELTESGGVGNTVMIQELWDKLKEYGVYIALDDFGTGYSSLSVLLEIPANVVKIDKSFTDKIHQNGQSAFVYQMGQFIQSAKEEVIFEGIEEEQQRTFLMECGFNYGQGYYFDRPLPLEEFEKKYI